MITVTGYHRSQVTAENERDTVKVMVESGAQIVAASMHPDEAELLGTSLLAYAKAARRAKEGK